MQLKLVSLGVVGVLLVTLASIIPEGTCIPQQQNAGKGELKSTKKPSTKPALNTIKKTKTVTVELDRRQQQADIFRKLVKMSFGTKFCDQCTKFIDYANTNAFKIKVGVKVGCNNYLEPKICNHIFRIEGEFFKVMKKNKNDPKKVCKQFSLC